MKTTSLIYDGKEIYSWVSGSDCPEPKFIITLKGKGFTISKASDSGIEPYYFDDFSKLEINTKESNHE